MELWVRSQDKETIMKIDRVDIDKEKEIWVNGYDVFVAKYNSKERALEVLDEIQRHLVVINDKNDNYFYVYEMPED